LSKARGYEVTVQVMKFQVKVKFQVKLVSSQVSFKSSQVSSLALPFNKEGWSDPFKQRDEGIHPSEIRRINNEYL
jgi:hypothetical protein